MDRPQNGDLLSAEKWAIVAQALLRTDPNTLKVVNNGISEVEVMFGVPKRTVHRIMEEPWQQVNPTCCGPL